MKKIDFKQLFKKHWIHLLALVLFFGTTYIYFQPQFSGYGLKQHDVQQFQGMSNEINHYRSTHQAEPLWTNSMFGGMPTYQISTHFPGNKLTKIGDMFHIWMKSPAGMFFGYLIGFYLMLLFMRIDPKIAILGAFAFAFSSYYIIILQAGHNTKAYAIGMAPPVIGAFYMAYRHSIKWGILLSALFMGLQLTANHIQISYYLGILLAFLGIGELIRYSQKKEILRFAKISAGIIIAYVFAFGINYGKLTLTNDYAKYTIRGGNDITINTDGTSNAGIKTSGLDKDYVTQWSYGIAESFTLISPNIKGGGTSRISDSQFADDLKNSEVLRRTDSQTRQWVGGNNAYWGDQPFTSGPVYLGVIVVFLALLGMVYLKGIQKWMLLLATLLTLMLSWGKNFMGLTDFFLDNVPFYNKFRAVTIILAIVEITVPLLAVLFLNELFKRKEEIKNNIKPLFITTGVFVGLLVTLVFTGLGDGYMSEQESVMITQYEGQILRQIQNENPETLKQHGIDINNPAQVQQLVDEQMKSIDKQFDTLVEFRKSIYQASLWRSVFLVILGFATIFLFLKTNFKSEFILAGLFVLIVSDLVQVDLQYLNNEKIAGNKYKFWIEDAQKDFPFTPTPADFKVMEMEFAENPELLEIVEAAAPDSKENRRAIKNEVESKRFQVLSAATNYRVFEPQLGFSDSRASYFHKAVNGYHGAKLRRIQNVKDFHLDNGNMNVFNMLNVKYFLHEDDATKNPEALGACWLVREINVQPNPDRELLALGKLFTIENKSKEKLIINGIEKQNDTIFGKEKIVLFSQDSLKIDLSNIIRTGISSSLVEDVNGSRDWIPNSELVKDTTNSFTALLAISNISMFNPRTEAIVGKEVATSLSSLNYSGMGEINMKSYAPNELIYEVDINETEFAVFSEMHYPDGWNAYIDGEKVDIHRVNYLLRGIELPAGKYELVMKFEVAKYNTSNQFALIGSLLLFILIGGLFVKDFVLEKKEK